VQTLTVELEHRSYPIHIGPGLLGHPELIADRLPQKRAALITNSTVGPLYAAVLRRALESRGVSVVPVTLPDGESYKDWATLNSIFDALLENRCERRTALIALGGGVIGDLAGFAAAVYQRGVPFVQVPTTLLAQVDSAVGGKTAINHPLGKNMIGAFYQPLAVVSDTDTLATLPPRELAAGIAEIVKYGVIRDRAFFEWLEANMPRLVAREPEALAYAIERSCAIKAEIVARDERETGDRALLNYGHTFGHAIETALGFGQWLHGEAVAAGMALAAKLSNRLGLLGIDAVNRIVALLERAGLPTAAPGLGVERYLELMGHDKKVQGGQIRFILARGLGDAFVSAEVPRAALADVLAERRSPGPDAPGRARSSGHA
jgi:3-dehydroquinate synthase